MSGTGLAGRDGTRRRGTRDGTGQEGAGHGTGRDPQIRTKRDGMGRDDFLVVPRSPGTCHSSKYNIE